MGGDLGPTFQGPRWGLKGQARGDLVCQLASQGPLVSSPCFSVTGSTPGGEDTAVRMTLQQGPCTSVLRKQNHLGSDLGPAS